MKSKLTIKSDNNIMVISKNESLELELKLNLSEYGKKWSAIGDHLYNFYIKSDYSNIILVNEFQFNYLKSLFQNK